MLIYNNYVFGMKISIPLPSGFFLANFSNNVVPKQNLVQLM